MASSIQQKSPVHKNHTENNFIPKSSIPSRMTVISLSTNTPTTESHFRNIHSLILQEFLNDTHDPRLKVFDNKNKTIKNINSSQWINTQEHNKHFNLHATRKGDQQQLRIIHRLETELTVHRLKKNPKIQTILRENKVYLRQHHWSEEIHDVITPLYLLELDPKHVLIESAQQKFHELLNRRKSPTIRLVPTKISSSTIKNSSVNVFGVQVQRENASELLQSVVPTITNGTKKLILAKLKYTDEKTSRKRLCIKCRPWTNILSFPYTQRL